LSVRRNGIDTEVANPETYAAPSGEGEIAHPELDERNGVEKHVHSAA
jgi:hypothetical protein